MTFRPALFAYLDTLPPCHVSGWSLQQAVERATGRRPYPTSVLKAARDYADMAGAVFKCVDPVESRYRFEPGAKISGAIFGGKE